MLFQFMPRLLSLVFMLSRCAGSFRTNVAFQSPRCVPVTRLTFVNLCGTEIIVGDWDVTVPAGGRADIYEQIPSTQRVKWRFPSSHWWDYIEMNAHWGGPGTNLCGHPNYATYAGFTMSSKYEALNPDTGAYACSDPGAEVDHKAIDCPVELDTNSKCKGNKTAGAPFAEFVRAHSWAINPDGTRTHAFKWTEWGENYANYWCSRQHTYGFLVATMVGCTNEAAPIELRVTTCSAGESGPAPAGNGGRRRRHHHHHHHSHHHHHHGHHDHDHDAHHDHNHHAHHDHRRRHHTTSGNDEVGM